MVGMRGCREPPAPYFRVMHVPSFGGGECYRAVAWRVLRKKASNFEDSDPLTMELRTISGTFCYELQQRARPCILFAEV